jgi:DNA-binding MarR family transcriptional regulator
MPRAAVIAELFESMGALRRILAASPVGDAARGLPTRAQLGIMIVIEHDGPTGVKELAEKLCMSSSAVTQLADALAESGLLSRKQDKDDRRKIAVSLTAKGRLVLRKAKKSRMTAMATLLKPLTETDLRHLSTILRKIVRSHRDS